MFLLLLKIAQALVLTAASNIAITSVNNSNMVVAHTIRLANMIYGNSLIAIEIKYYKYIKYMG